MELQLSPPPEARRWYELPPPVLADCSDETQKRLADAELQTCGMIGPCPENAMNYDNTLAQRMLRCKRWIEIDINRSYIWQHCETLVHAQEQASGPASSMESEGYVSPWFDAQKDYDRIRDDNMHNDGSRHE